MRTSLLFSFILTALFTLGVNGLSAQTKQKPYTAKVYTSNNRLVRGTLQSADDKGVYLSGRRGDTATFVNALQIKEIKLRRKNKSGTGSTIGFLFGAAAGVGAYIALDNGDKLENTIRALSGVLFTFTTTAIGGAISSRPDEVIHINGRNEDYLQVLQHLQSLSTQGAISN